NGDEQVALAAGTEVRQAMAGHANNVAALDASLECVIYRSVQRRHLELAAEGGLAEAERHLANQVIAVALEERMLFHVHANDEIAARGARLSGLAFATQCKLQAGERACGDVDLERPPHGDVALAAAFATRVGDDLAAAAAPAAGLLHAEEALAHD